MVYVLQWQHVCVSKLYIYNVDILLVSFPEVLKLPRTANWMDAFGGIDLAYPHLCFLRGFLFSAHSNWQRFNLNTI
jgi:hypothetical protein